MEQAHVERRREACSQCFQPQRVLDLELDAAGRNAATRLDASLLDGGSCQVDAQDPVTPIREIEGVLTRAATNVEHRAVDPAARLEPHHGALGSPDVPGGRAKVGVVEELHRQIMIWFMGTDDGGTASAMPDSVVSRTVDCAIVGGGPAGLSAAVNMARMRRNVLVIDDRDGRSLWSQTNRNYLGFPDGIPAAEIRRQGRRQAANYGARFLRGRVTTATREGAVFRLHVDGRAGEGAGTDANVARDDELGRALGELEATGLMEIVARTVILATGVRDPFPEFPGRDDCVGRSLFWCIACDGYESIGCNVAVVGFDDEAVQTALDILDFTERVTLVAGRADGFDVAEARLADVTAAGIPAHPCSVAEYQNDNGQISGLILGDSCRSHIPVEMVFAVRPPVARNEVAVGLGVAVDARGQVIVDTEQHTNVAGVYAAGDMTSPHNHQVSAAVHEGNEAACTANYYLYRPEQKAPVGGR